MNKTKKIKILHVFADPSFGIWILGPLVQMQSQIGNYNIEFACSDGDYFKDLLALQYPVNAVPISRDFFTLKHLKAFFGLYRLISENKYHIVHVHTPTASYIARFAAALAKTPIIIMHMRTSWWQSKKTVLPIIFTILEKISSIFTNHTFTINCEDANDVVRFKIQKEENVTCLHCGSIGVDTARFNPDKINPLLKNDLQHSLGIQPDDIVIGFIGRIVSEKGILDLTNAFLKIAKKNQNTKLLIVGDVLSSERDRTTMIELDNFINKNRLANRIIRVGFKNEIPLYLSVMNILVLPSKREGFGMVLAEASSMKIPVISTDTRGGKEAVLDGITGFLTPIGDVESLSISLLNLIKQPHKRKSMGAAGRLYALENLDIKIVFSRMQKVYVKLLEENQLL